MLKDMFSDGTSKANSTEDLIAEYQKAAKESGPYLNYDEFSRYLKIQINREKALTKACETRLLKFKSAGAPDCMIKKDEELRAKHIMKTNVYQSVLTVFDNHRELITNTPAEGELDLIVELSLRIDDTREARMRNEPFIKAYEVTETVCEELLTFYRNPKLYYRTQIKDLKNYPKITQLIPELKKLDEGPEL